jgi:hypothetical protein
MISGFRRKANENCALLFYYAASSDNFLPMFRDNLSVPSSGIKNPKGFGAQFSSIPSSCASAVKNRAFTHF